MWRAGTLKTWDFKHPQRKKSHVETSDDLAGHMMSPYLEITWLGNRVFTTATDACAVWHVALSYWNKFRHCLEDD
jgi:hypothetical protein